MEGESTRPPAVPPIVSPLGSSSLRAKFQLGFFRGIGPDYEQARADAASYRDARRVAREAIRSDLLQLQATRSDHHLITLVATHGSAPAEPPKVPIRRNLSCDAAVSAALEGRRRLRQTTDRFDDVDGQWLHGRGTGPLAVASDRFLTLQTGLLPEAQGRRTSSVLGLCRVPRSELYAGM
jgi:hypothetical protein